MDNVQSFTQPTLVEVKPSEASQPEAIGCHSLTPGSYAFRELPLREEIFAIVERREPERHCVTIALEEDPDDLLDLIFKVEQRMFKKFERVPFDLRVTVPASKDALASILSSGFVHFKRQ